MLRNEQRSVRARWVRRACLASLLVQGSWVATASAQAPRQPNAPPLPPLPVKIDSSSKTDFGPVTKNPYCQLRTAQLVPIEPAVSLRGLAQPALSLRPIEQVVDESIVAASNEAEIIQPNAVLKLKPLFAQPEGGDVKSSAAQPVKRNPLAPATPPQQMRPAASASPEVHANATDVAAQTQATAAKIRKPKPAEAAELTPATPAVGAPAEDADGNEPVTFRFSDTTATTAKDAPAEVASEPVELSLADSEAAASEAREGLPEPVTIEPVELATAKPLPPGDAENESRSDPANAFMPGELRENPLARGASAAPPTSAAKERADEQDAKQQRGAVNALDHAPIVVASAWSLDRDAVLVQASRSAVIDVPAERDPATTAQLAEAAVAEAPVAEPDATEAALSGGAVPEVPKPSRGTVRVASNPAAAKSASPESNAVASTYAEDLKQVASAAAQEPEPQVDFGGQLASEPMQLIATEVHTLPLPKAAHCFAIQNHAVCRVVPANNQALRVVGGMPGTTRIAVWFSADTSQPPRLYEVKVAARPEPELQGLAKTAAALTQTLRETFPTSRVAVLVDGEQLVIRGSVTSDREARKMLQRVRRTCLVPVRDELLVR